MAVIMMMTIMMMMMMMMIVMMMMMMVMNLVRHGRVNFGRQCYVVFENYPGSTEYACGLGRISQEQGPLVMAVSREQQP